MRIRPGHHSHGIALIVALIAILVLSALAAGLAVSLKVETRLAYNANSETQLYWLGRSGVELARWVLAQERCPYDSLNQIWAGGPGSDCETNGPLAGFSLDNYAVGGGTISIKIVDLERKANINTASGLEIQQALTDMGVDASQISVVADSIQDWIAPAGPPRVAGAESDYYQGLDPPYYAKNAPMDDISELLHVRGILDHPEIYDPKTYGGNADDAAGPVFHHKLGFGNTPGQVPDYPFGLKDVFTPISNGHVNINTADADVLQMVLGGDATAAENIIKLRAGPDGVDGTEDDTPFANPAAALQTAGVNPALVGQAANILTTRSSTFEVHVTAQIGVQEREYVAILFRNSPADIAVLSFYWK
ncbi:MAG TPA: general secretion pathway protein GspK [Verrucomicrobiae bacterium]|nr:general secretion pathway protein GspK [Verrucomicrobiae bacterium]